jgi:hypothetical protein
MGTWYCWSLQSCSRCACETRVSLLVDAELVWPDASPAAIVDRDLRMDCVCQRIVSMKVNCCCVVACAAPTCGRQQLTVSLQSTWTCPDTSLNTANVLRRSSGRPCRVAACSKCSVERCIVGRPLPMRSIKCCMSNSSWACAGVEGQHRSYTLNKTIFSRAWPDILRNISSRR